MGNNSSGLRTFGRDGIARCNRHAVQSFQVWVEVEMPALAQKLGLSFNQKVQYKALQAVLIAVRGETEMVSTEDLIAVFWAAVEMYS